MSNLTNKHSFALKVSASLWIIWGLVHAFAGILVLTADTASGFRAIADAVPAESFATQYNDAVGGILNQHAWNLLWFAVVTMVGAVFIWRHKMTAIWITGMVGGLADIGYFLFVDIPGYVHFFPGTLMTLVSGTAIVLSFWVFFSNRNA